MDLNQWVTQSPHVISQVVAGETVLLDLESENYFGLDTVGTRVWQLIAESGNLGDIFATLLAEYEVEESRLHLDLADLLEDATARGLVTLRAITG